MELLNYSVPLNDNNMVSFERWIIAKYVFLYYFVVIGYNGNKNPVENTLYLALDAHNSKTKSVTPIFYCWKIISMQPLNFLQLYKNFLGADSEPP